MILKIGNKKAEHYNDFALTMSFDSVASAFSFSYFFDPTNSEHREMFKPGSFKDATVEHEGDLLVTGNIISTSFASSASQELVRVAGYSKTGVIEDCEIPVSAYPLQSNGLTLRQITEKVTNPFGLKVLIDPAVTSKVNAKYIGSTAGDNQSVKQYLSDICNQKNVRISHDQHGNIILTEPKTNQQPLYDFTTGMPWVQMSLDFDGQRMHGDITMQKQANKRGGNSGRSSIKNPYVAAGFRPKVVRQTSGSTVDTERACRTILSDELKGIQLKIEIQGWKLDGKIVKPNSIVTVTNPDLFLFKKTKFFIESVEYRGDSMQDTATLHCVLPEVYGSGTPINIFD